MHQQHQRGEHQHPQRGRHHRPQVHRHARVDEEDRDEEAVAERVQLALQRRQARCPPTAAAPCRPGTRRAPRRGGTARSTASSSVSSRTVPRTVICVVSCSPSSMNVRIRSMRNDRDSSVRPNATAATATSEMSATQRFGRAEEHGDRDDRQQLADRAGREKVLAEPAAQQVVARAGSAGACPAPSSSARWRRERTPGRAPGVQQPDDPAGQRDGHQPRQRRAASGVRAQEPLVDLVAGEEEQEAEPDVGQDLRASPASRGPRPCGPISIPPRISRTTCGMRGPGNSATTIGASTATTAIASNVPSAECTSSASPSRSRASCRSCASLGNAAGHPVERVAAITAPLGGRVAGSFTAVREHVPLPTAEAARAAAKEVDADVLLAIGGGSTVGAAKAVALTAGCRSSPCRRPTPAPRSRQCGD